MGSSAQPRGGSLTGRVLGLFVLAVAPGLALGQEAQEAAPWDRPAARAEARRALGAARELLAATERRDARPAAEALRDPCWSLRLLAIERLRVLGLDRPTLDALRTEAGPRATLPSGEWPAGEAARAYAGALPVAPQAQPPELTRLDALQALIGAALNRIEQGPEDAATKRELASGLLAYRAVIPAGERAWLAEALGGLIDERALLRDLGQPDLHTACGEDGAAVLRWWTQNAASLVWSPERKRFLVERGAPPPGEGPGEGE